MREDKLMSTLESEFPEYEFEVACVVTARRHGEIAHRMSRMIGPPPEADCEDGERTLVELTMCDMIANLRDNNTTHDDLLVEADE